MQSVVGGRAVVVLVLFTAACGRPGPTPPTGPSPEPPAPPLQAPQTLPPATDPPLVGPARTFVFDREVRYSVRDFTKQSRFVLYDNGAFVLQYPGYSEPGYRGVYTQEDGVTLFYFLWSGGPKFGATGTTSGDSLAVRYIEVMQHSDFEDAVYVRAP